MLEITQHYYHLNSRFQQIVFSISGNEFEYKQNEQQIIFTLEMLIFDLGRCGKNAFIYWNFFMVELSAAFLTSATVQKTKM